MNIVLDCERMKYPYTGLNTFCRQLSEAMVDTVSSQDELSFFIAPQNNNFLGNDKLYIKQHFINKILPVYINNLDIWHTTYQLSKYTGGTSKTKKILTIHDLNFLYEKSPSDIVRYLKKHQSILDRADHIVAISEYVKNDVLTHLNLRDKPISVIYNGYKVVEYIKFDSPQYRPLKPFILAMGTITPKKNFHTLPALLKNNDYELIVAGSISNYQYRIQEAAEKHNVSERVKLLGPISDQEKYWYLKNCSAFAFPSITEGFGLPVLEAMHFGKPVFLSNLTCLPEIGGEHAYYFENFTPEHMQQIFERSMEDYESKHKSLLIKQHANKFSWQRCAQDYYNLYQRVLK